MGRNVALAVDQVRDAIDPVEEQPNLGVGKPGEKVLLLLPSDVGR
jgi:hypothetical protein